MAALPSVPLAKKSVTVGGVEVEFRSLSRKEALHVTQAFKDDVDAAEDYILACGVGCSVEEARDWRAITDPLEAGKLIDGILYLTGLATKDEAAGPKA